MQYNDDNRLITAWGYIGYALLFSIPLVGLICVIVFSFSSTYPCRRNFARSYLIVYVIALIVTIILIAAGFSLTGILAQYGYRHY